MPLHQGEVSPAEDLSRKNRAKWYFDAEDSDPPLLPEGPVPEDPRQLHLFDYKPELPINGELELDLEKPFPKHMRLERMVFRLVQAYPSGRVHTRQIRDHLLNEGKMNGTHADISRLHRVFTRSGGFERIGHGYYQVKPDYRPKPLVSEIEARLFVKLGVSRRS